MNQYSNLPWAYPDLIKKMFWRGLKDLKKIQIIEQAKTRKGKEEQKQEIKDEQRKKGKAL